MSEQLIDVGGGMLMTESAADSLGKRYAEVLADESNFTPFDIEYYKKMAEEEGWE